MNNNINDNSKKKRRKTGCCRLLDPYMCNVFIKMEIHFSV